MRNERTCCKTKQNPPRRRATSVPSCKCTVYRWASPRHYTVDPMLPPLGNPFKCHEDVLSLQTMIPPTKRFDISPPCVGCSEGLDAFRFFFKQTQIHILYVNTTSYSSISTMVLHMSTTDNATYTTTAVTDAFRFFFKHTQTHTSKYYVNTITVLSSTNHVEFGRICTEFQVLQIWVNFRNSMVPP